MNFFRKKNLDEKFDVTLEQQLAEQQVAPGTQLHYHSRLIARLQSHHAELLDLASKSMQMAQASRFDEARKYVRKFRRLLNEHMLEKNLRLYTFLNCCLQADPEGLELTRSMRREMGEISRKSMRFITHYDSVGVNEESAPEFLDELAQIKTLLSDRCTHEANSLYTLYRPPQFYADSATQPTPPRSRSQALAVHAVA